MIQETVQIRPLLPDDALPLYHIVTDPRVYRTLTLSPSMELGQTQEWASKRSPQQHRLVAVWQGQVVGLVSLSGYANSRLRHFARLGLYVHADYWGRGIGTALLGQALSLADNWLNLHRIELDVYTDNPAAIHLYEKFGFVVEGTRQQAIFGGDGRFHDEYVMARLHGVESLAVHSDPLPWPVRLPAIERISATIRPLHPQDAADMHALWTNPLVCRTTLQLSSREYGWAEDRVREKDPYTHRLVAVRNGRSLGMISLRQLTNPRLAHSAGLGMMVHPDYWGQGIGGQLMSAILQLADNWLNLQRVELDVNTDNPVGVNLYQKFGFAIEGIRRYHTYGDGRWADSYFMARRKPHNLSFTHSGSNHSLPVG